MSDPNTVCIADCLAGWHHPPGNPCVCIVDVIVQTVPTLSEWGLIGLAVMIVIAAWLQVSPEGRLP